MIDEFISAVKDERFVEAHELLEDEWQLYKRQGQKEKSQAIKGLINGATSLALYVKRRPEAHEKIWKVYEKYKPLLFIVELENIEKYIIAAKLIESKKDSITN